jgi:hypothetical protein
MQIYTREVPSSHDNDCHHYGILVSDAVYFDIQSVSKMLGQTSSVSSLHDKEEKIFTEKYVQKWVVEFN